MDPSLKTAATGMAAQQTRIDVIANNLANVNTPGFKRSRAHFEDLLYQTVEGQETVGTGDADVAEAIQIGRGTRLSDVQRVHEQGTFEMTNRPMDLAIDGEGLFQVRRPDGTIGYTRDGSFTISHGGSGSVTVRSHLRGLWFEVFDEAAGGQVYCDGILRDFAPGEVLRFAPGESVTLMPGDWHAFWGEGGDDTDDDERVHVAAPSSGAGPGPAADAVCDPSSARNTSSAAIASSRIVASMSWVEKRARSNSDVRSRSAAATRSLPSRTEP